jgi:hypothetical protein
VDVAATEIVLELAVKAGPKRTKTVMMISKQSPAATSVTIRKIDHVDGVAEDAADRIRKCPQKSQMRVTIPVLSLRTKNANPSDDDGHAGEGETETKSKLATTRALKNRLVVNSMKTTTTMMTVIGSLADVKNSRLGLRRLALWLMEICPVVHRVIVDAEVATAVVADAVGAVVEVADEGMAATTKAETATTTIDLMPWRCWPQLEQI